MSDIAITFTVELLADLHTGTGVGQLGLVDDTQSRDQRGRPVVWASTLRGLLREAGEDYLLSLKDAGVADAEISTLRRCLHNALGQTSAEEQGSSAGCASVRSLRCLEDHPTNCFIIWSSTAREIHSRRPMDNTLRQVEHACAGLSLKGEIRLPAGKDAEAKLLCQFLRRLPSLGSGKTRGWGQIQIKDDPTCVPLRTPPNQTGALPTGAPVWLRLLLKNLEPLNLAATAFAGNIIHSQSCIPGTRLRAALLHWLNPRQEQLADKLADPQLMQVGNSYFVPPDLKDHLSTLQLLPLPLSLEEPKGGQGTRKPTADSPWWSQPGLDSDLLGASDERDKFASPGKREEDFKRVKTEEYAVRAGPGERWRRVHPKMGVLMRNQVPTGRLDRLGRFGRVQSDSDLKGELFSEQVLWEDQLFVADLRFADHTHANQFRQAAAELLAGQEDQRSWLRVGRGGRPVVVSDMAWITPAFTTPKGPEEVLTLTLTSDLIARSPWLTFCTALNLETLKGLLEDIGSAVPGLDGLRAEDVSEVVEVHGFNSATGLLRAPALAFQRGSVLQLRAQNEVGKMNLVEWRKALATLVSSGLGERTAEGLGRFVLDLELHRESYWKHESEVREKSLGRHRGDVWQEAVLAKVEKFLDEHKAHLSDRRGKQRPSVSQWQWLRSGAETARNRAEVDRVLEELTTHAQTLAARTKWKALPNALEKAVAEVATLSAQPFEGPQYFLIELARAAVARMRQKRRSGEDRE